ncbi:MAG TPA: hypothetical protein ENK85_07705 [Saprospiraceae bacterium]|nr:hypothetical protein [Saprospiraceae bacterium]
MTKFYQKNNLQLGIGIGLLLPLLVYFLLHGIYAILEQNGHLANSISVEFRQRTIALLAIAIDVIPMRYYQKNRFWVDTMRGVTIAMAVLAFTWMIYFVPGIFGH